jgi:PKD repeat protein
MAITAEFSATTAREGFVPLTVDFQDLTTGGTPVYWRWTFGDGTQTENVANPSHTYTEEGIYNVILYVRDASNNESTEIKSQYIIANGVYVLSENTIMQSQESGSPDKYWRFYIDEDLHIIFRYNNLLYKTIDPAAILDKWMLLEFHPGDNFIFLATADEPRKIIPSKTVDTGAIPTVSNNRIYVAKNSSMKIDELKIWRREENLRPYYRSLKAQVYLLEQADNA